MERTGVNHITAAKVMILRARVYEVKQPQKLNTIWGKVMGNPGKFSWMLKFLQAARSPSLRFSDILPAPPFPSLREAAPTERYCERDGGGF
ncbi:MAG: hypothetical protein V7K47_18050 [Nostoc sp.]